MPRHLRTRFSDLFRDITAPASKDPDSARMEYMTKTVMLFLTAVAAFSLVCSIIGWIFSFIPADTGIIIFLLGLFFIAGWSLAHHGKWRIAGAIPSALLFLSAAYGNIIGGIDAPAMVLYVLAIILAAVLRGLKDMYITLTLSLVAYLAAGLAHNYGILHAQRSADSAFANRVTITVTVIAGITLLVRFLIIQFQNALESARSEIADRKNAEEALRLSEKKYRELVQNANSIIIRLNMRGEIVFWNEFAELFFGYQSAEILGRSVMETIVPELESGTGKNLHGMIRDLLAHPGEYLSQENENITRTGKKVWIAWANRLVYGPDGTITGLLCVGNDITERKRAQDENERIQKQLIQAQKMEAIGTLTSGLAHDFNNILGGIMGSLSLLDIILKEERSGISSKAEGYLKIAVESSRRASEMIRQLLILSRRQEITLSPVDINVSLAHVVTICMSSFPKSVSISARYAHAPAFVHTDPILIEQILLNLCVNASHAMTIMRKEGSIDGGTLTVSVSAADIAGSDIPPDIENCLPGRYIITEIRDTGVGMDEETQKRIFEPFFTMKKKDQGTGLGLSIAYGFISQTGGFITVRSEEGKGSCFRIYLPEQPVQDTQPQPDAEEPGLVAGTGNILIIDDEQFIIDVARETLSACGYTVTTARSGMEGVSIFEKNWRENDAVLLDLSMPGLSGVDVLSRLRMINPAVKVLLSSGFSDDPGVQQALDNGAAGFVQKPYTAETLSRRMYDIIHLS